MRRAVNVRIGEVYDRDSRTKFEDEMKRFDAIVIGGGGRLVVFVQDRGPRPSAG